jgi:hypothetical protein
VALAPTTTEKVDSEIDSSMSLAKSSLATEGLGTTPVATSGPAGISELIPDAAFLQVKANAAPKSDSVLVFRYVAFRL